MQRSLCIRSFISASLMLAIILLSQFAWSEDFDIRGINFKLARPSNDESLTDVVAEPAQDSMAILEIDADFFLHHPKFGVRVVGFTDDRECTGSNCILLSQRRAKYVYDWLIRYGVPRDQLYGPEGEGSAEPIDNNATEEGRARNRRVELQVMGSSPLTGG
jgi:OmpA-OmpF porin, OOP family